MNDKMSSASPAIDAWRRYHVTLEKLHQEFLAHPYANHPVLRAQGLYFLQSLQASAFNIYVAPKTHFPALYVHGFFMPFELSWGMPNPDFLNRNGFIDGAHCYRIYGCMSGNFWATLQVFRGFWGDDLQGDLGHLDFDDLPRDEHGRFEFFLGPTPPTDAQGKTWIRLDPEAHNIMLALREVAYDWERDSTMEVHIEMIDRPHTASMLVDEAELASRIDRAGRFATMCWKLASGQLRRAQSEQKRNEFAANPEAGKHGGNPLASYVQMTYELGEQDALIIELPIVEARYWGLQMGSVWTQTTDYSYHQSSLNGAQACVDVDGRVRIVVSLQDPGVPNWLDPVGVPVGVVMLRWYKSVSALVPDVTRTTLSTLRERLPAETPRVSPQQRRDVLERRRGASLRRYGQ